MNISINAIIRNAIIHNADREGQFIEIEHVLGCTRAKVKKLYYAFLYKADDAYLEKLLEEKEL